MVLKSMPSVLLVDDEPSLRLTMGEFLKRAGYTVSSAADYESAAKHEAEDIDVAVIDINLPGKSGIEGDGNEKMFDALLNIPTELRVGGAGITCLDPGKERRA